MKDCIIKENEIYKLSSYDDKSPNNFVIEKPAYNNAFGIQYQIAKNGIDIHWTDGTYVPNILFFRYKGVEIETIQNPNLNEVCDALNKYNSISNDEFNKIVIVKQYAKIQELEAKVKELTKDKIDLLAKLNKN